jgi:hypothetical protein
MDSLKRLLWIAGIFAIAAMLSDFFNSGIFMIAALVIITVIGGGASRGRARSSPRRKASNEKGANDLAAFQHSHTEIGSAHLQNRCGSCAHWNGAKTTHKSFSGEYVNKQEIGDCMLERPGSPRKNLKATAGQACADYDY